MDEISVGFERVRVVEEAEEASKRAERKRLEEIAAVEAAEAVAVASMTEGEEPRRSLRRKPGPPKTVCSRELSVYRRSSISKGDI